MFGLGNSDLPVLEAGWKRSEAPQGEGSWVTWGWDRPHRGLVRNLLLLRPLLPTCWASGTLTLVTPHLQSVHPGPSVLPELTAMREVQQLFSFYRQLAKASRVLTPSRRNGVFMVFIPEDGALRLTERY